MRFVEGADGDCRAEFAAVLSISLAEHQAVSRREVRQSQLYQERGAGQHPARRHLRQARELHFATDVSRVVFIVRVTSGGDISAYDVVSQPVPRQAEGLRLQHQRDGYRPGQGDP